MSSNSSKTAQMFMMMGLGAMALIQGVQLYRMQKQIIKQDQTLESSRSSRQVTEADVDSESEEEVKMTRARVSSGSYQNSPRHL